MPEINAPVYLRPSDVGEEIELTVVDPGGPNIIPGRGKDADKEVFEIGVQLPNGQRKTWTMNEKSQRTVGAVLGTNSDDWVGEKIVTYSHEQDVFGTKKLVIYARLPEKKK